MAKGFRFTQWPYLLHTDPESLKQGIRDAMVSENANMPKVWKALGDVSPTMFYQYVRKLGMKGELAELRTHILGRRRYARGVYSNEAPRAKPEPVIGSVGRS
jgi:hypothetical protein